MQRVLAIAADQRPPESFPNEDPALAELAKA
jgi:hypothetical protein